MLRLGRLRELIEGRLPVRVLRVFGAVPVLRALAGTVAGRWGQVVPAGTGLAFLPSR